MSRSAWIDFVASFLREYFDQNPTFAANAGRHEYDGRLPDWSSDGLRRKVEWLREQRAAAAAFDPAPLEPARRLEREHLIAQIDSEIFWLADAELPWRNPMFYAYPLDPALYLTRPYAPLETRMRAFIDYARGVPRAAEHARANLRTPLPRTFAHLGRLTLGGLAGYYEKDVPQVFAAVEDPGLQAELREAIAGAAAATRDLDAWFARLEDEAAEMEDGYAFGPERFRRMLRDSERVDLPLEVLEAAGRRELERNLAALREACAAYAPGLSLADCVERVQAEKPVGGPVEAARRQLAGLRSFLEETNLVTIPGDEQALIAESPPYQRWNSAYIDIPGPYDRHLPSIYYIAPPDPSWTPAEREAYVSGEADLLFVTIHEVWPGHFLQFLHSNRAESEIGQLFVGYGYAEGWAHYSEELMWEAGFGAGEPRLRIGQLQNALLRNVRYLVALGLHTGGMTLAEAERMFREQGFQDAANARQQAARGTFDPAYLNYTLGKLMVRKLRDDWTGPRGGRRAWREFHDRLLSYGGPPLPLVRRTLLGPGSNGSLL
jgi:hypothetical protein